MKATIYHNAACGTSRGALAILESTPGIELEIIDYLRQPPTRARLIELYRTAGITPRQGLRTNSSPAAELCAQLGLAEADDDAVLDAMMAHPILINRPLIETEKGVRLCRPHDVVHEIL